MGRGEEQHGPGALAAAFRHGPRPVFATRGRLVLSKSLCRGTQRQPRTALQQPELSEPGRTRSDRGGHPLHEPAPQNQASQHRPAWPGATVSIHAFSGGPGRYLVRGRYTGKGSPVDCCGDPELHAGRRFPRRAGRSAMLRRKCRRVCSRRPAERDPAWKHR